MSESDVMLIAGWKTPVMLRPYLGSNEEGQRQALAAADKVFGTGSVPSSLLEGEFRFEPGAGALGSRIIEPKRRSKPAAPFAFLIFEDHVPSAHQLHDLAHAD